MQTQFNPLLVTLSVLVAILASYVALNLAYNGILSKGRRQAIWLAGGALVMGIGIWSMHFVGMLAFEMPGMAMAYDVPLMILSVIVAISASALAFYITSRSVVPTGSIVASSIAMAVAIAGMHYIGMYSMRMDAVIRWNAYLVVLSVVIALVASLGALWMLIRMRTKKTPFWQILVASIIMGFAVSGMHYTGMLAATFVHGESTGIESSNLLVSSGLAVTVILTTLLILAIGFVSSVFQKMWVRESEDAKEILVKSEEKFRHLVDAVKDYAIFMLDLNGNITTWNTGAERITGYTESEVIGKHISLFFIKEDLSRRTAAEELQVAKETGHFKAEVRQKRKDGSIYWADIVLTPLYDSEGKISGFSKVIRDTTEMKAAEKRMLQLNEELESRVKARTNALASREQQLRSITNASPILIAQVDLDQKFSFANNAFCKWFQCSIDTITEKSLKEVVGEKRFEEVMPFIKRVLEGEEVSYERASPLEGDSFLAITLVPDFDQHKNISGFIIIGTDVTRYKEIQLELEKAKEAAEVANTTKSAFLANMSHEIRTPLGAVLGFSELLASSEMSPSERLNSAEVIKRNGRLLSNIINDILDLSKVEAGKLQVEKVDVPFTDVMKEMSSVLSLEAAEKGIELKVTSEGIIPTEIKTDPLRLRQVLFNIVGNAIKFTSQGSVSVMVKLLPAADAATKLAFVVKDTGEGIRPEQVARLFTPFTQADVSTTRRFGGTGLGLVLSKKLANALGGDVVLTESTPGKGSTFVVSIDPGISQKVLFESSKKATENLDFPMDRGTADLHSLKILVVDDSQDNLALIRKILVLAGARVETANTGKDGVEKALHSDFDLILMDLQMPEMDGYEANRRLRAAGYNKPIIALTAHAMKEERLRTLRSGFDDHITKPIDQGSLIRTLSEYS